MNLISCLIFSFALPFVSSAQLVTSNNDPYNLVYYVLGSSGAQVSNVSYTGAPNAIAGFSADVYNMPFSSGVILTTGTTLSGEAGPYGPNNSASSGLDNNRPGNQLMSQVVGASTYNAAVLEFDIVVPGDSLLIDYIFASEEYPEFVESEFTDLPVIVVSGPGIAGAQNLAVLPSGTIVSVNTVNGGNGDTLPSNPGYFISNGNGSEAPFNTSDSYLQYDGMTIPLTARTAVVAGETYHIVIGIADVNDGIYDSAIFLKGGGMTVSVPENEELQAAVSPNPGNGIFTVTAKNSSGIQTYQVTDAFGKIILSGEYAQSLDLDLSTCIDGIYFLKLNSGKAFATKKIMKM